MTIAKCRRILVVEDDEAIRELLRFALEEQGYCVAFASNGREAISELEVINQPCLILLDLMMPVMDGWEFAKTLQADPRLQKNPIVLLTASCERLDDIPHKEMLKKPLNIHRLYEAVDRYAEAAMA